ncbi:MAG: hypothetical protein IT483_02825 [Gammaproteobacteria bacterium]|nr:hypothetical protein [Gammaproteobacteria bacterium]
MSSRYDRVELGQGRIRYTVHAVAPPPGNQALMRWAPLGAAVFFGLIVVGSGSPGSGFFGMLIRWAIAIGGGIYLHRWVKDWASRNAGGGGAEYSFITAASGITTSSRQMGSASAVTELPRSRIRSLSVSDWSTAASPSAAAIYADLEDDSSVILATGMDGGTAAALLADASAALGLPTPAASSAPRPATPGAPPPLPAEAARQRLDELRQAAAATLITSAMEPIKPGDYILVQDDAQQFSLHRASEGARERLVQLPPSHTVAALEFAKGQAGESDLWFESLEDRGGPASLVNRQRGAAG